MMIVGPGDRAQWRPNPGMWLARNMVAGAVAGAAVAQQQQEQANVIAQAQIAVSTRAAIVTSAQMHLQALAVALVANPDLAGHVAAVSTLVAELE